MLLQSTLMAFKTQCLANSVIALMFYTNSIALISFWYFRFQSCGSTTTICVQQHSRPVCLSSHSTHLVFSSSTSLQGQCKQMISEAMEAV